jgi:HAD superfamily hydrolase (TIGR01509 family)
VSKTGNRTLMIGALIFDFDGVVAETEEPVFQSWSGLFRQHGQELEPGWWTRSVVGQPPGTVDLIAVLAKRVGAQLDTEALAVAQRQRENELTSRLAPLPGIREYLADAVRLGLKVGIASNSPRAWVVGHLERLGLAKRWDCISCREEVEHGKPSPDLYLRVVERMGVPASLVVAFEDSPTGVEAAKRAGLRCVAVPSRLTRTLDFDQADLRVESLGEVPLADLLVRLEARDR